MFDSRVHGHGTDVLLNLCKAVQITCRYVAAGSKPLADSYNRLGLIGSSREQSATGKGLDLL